MENKSKETDIQIYDPTQPGLSYSEVSDEEFGEKIVNLFKYEKSLLIEHKIQITNEILMNSNKITNYVDFFEEECHLVLVNWIYNLKDSLRKGFLDSMSYHLIYNILNIFETFPINLKDLLVLNIYQKLNKIRKLIKQINFNIFLKLDNLLSYWQTFLNDNLIMINKKRLRDDQEEKKEDSAEQIIHKVSIDFNTNYYLIYFIQFVNFLAAKAYKD